MTPGSPRPSLCGQLFPGRIRRLESGFTANTLLGLDGLCFVLFANDRKQEKQSG
jgi:hypothetical protein